MALSKKQANLEIQALIDNDNVTESNLKSIINRFENIISFWS